MKSLAPEKVALPLPIGSVNGYIWLKEFRAFAFLRRWVVAFARNASLIMRG